MFVERGVRIHVSLIKVREKTLLRLISGEEHTWTYSRQVMAMVAVVVEVRRV